MENHLIDRRIIISCKLCQCSINTSILVSVISQVYVRVRVKSSQQMLGQVHNVKTLRVEILMACTLSCLEQLPI